MKPALTPGACEILLSLQASFRLPASADVYDTELVSHGLAVRDDVFLIITDAGVLVAKQLLAERVLADRVFRASNEGYV